MNGLGKKKSTEKNKKKKSSNQSPESKGDVITTMG